MSDDTKWEIIIHKSGTSLAVHLNCPKGNIKKEIFPKIKTITLEINNICFCTEPIPEHIILQRKILNDK